jgi:hypothetical protein
MIVEFTLRGRDPLLMSNQRSSSPIDPLAREARILAGKRSKLSDEELLLLSNMEYRLRIYHDEALGPYIPGENVKRCIMDGAKMSKDGKRVESALWPIESRLSLQYPGPRDIEGLLADPDFRDTRMVKINSGLIQRTRPRFADWSLVVKMELDDQVMNLDQLTEFIRRAGAYKGLGDFRPRFGRFALAKEPK